MKYIFTELKMQNGIALVEVILASALFVFAVGAIVSGILFGNESMVSGGEYMRATHIAQEGLEGVRTIRDDQFSNVVNGTHGIINTSSSWVLSGSSSSIGYMNRVVSIGDVDVDTKSITSTVSWNSFRGFNKSISLNTKLTNWRKLSGKRSGMLVFADYGVGIDRMQYKTFSDTGTWSSAQIIPDTISGTPALRSLELYGSKTRNEKVVISKHFLGTTQSIHAQIWNGSIWGNSIQLSTWTSTALPNARSFDADYRSDGTLVVVYSDGTTTPKYRTWDGSVWSAESSLSSIGGIPQWIVVRTQPNGNQMMIAIRDDQNDTNTILWNGSSWESSISHATNSSGTTYENIGFTWNTASPSFGALVYTGGGGNNPNIKIWNGTSWSSAVSNINIGGVPRALEVVSHPTSSNFLACFKDSAGDINCLTSNTTPLWSGTILQEIENNTDNGAQKSFAIGYEQKTGSNGVSLYSGQPNPNLPNWRALSTSNTWTGETQTGSVGSATKSMRLMCNVGSDDCMGLIASTVQSLHSIMWDGTTHAWGVSGGYTLTTQATNGSNDLDYWFDFEWDQF